MLKNGRPYNLPQVSAPYSIVLNKLDDENIKYNILKIFPHENDNIKPLQSIVYSDEISNLNNFDKYPIWLSNDNNNVHICDGHHRYFRALLDNTSIIAIQLLLNHKDACRILNKIQDIYDYEQSQGLEEVEMQDTINYFQNDENQFLNSLEEDNLMIKNDIPNNNKKTIIAYRKDPIKENSSIGNFFMLKPINGYSKYEIDFDNLLDTEELGIVYKDSQQPIDILTKSWFPHINFEKISEKYNIPSINLKNKAISEKAMKMGFDGIKYGDTLLQGLK